MLKFLLLGALAMATFIAGMFFLRFWVRTRERFFLFFAAAFFIAAVGRVVLGVMPHTDDQTPLIYITQLLAFLLIIWAIVDKNRSGGGLK